MKKNIYNNQKGQTLLFVVVAMTIALSIGINTSVRTLTSLSRTSRTDTASRALAAAEGGIERYLALSSGELEDATEGACPEGEYSSDGGFDNGPACKIEFEDDSDVLVSQAFVTIERYAPTYYPFTLESGQLKEVNLYDHELDVYYESDDDDIEICWTSTDTGPGGGSELLYISYDRNGIQKRGLLRGNLPPGDSYESVGFDDSAGAGKDGYANCIEVIIGSDLYGLRIRSIGGTSDVAVYATDGGANAVLPLQGYRITSIGKLEQDQGVTATRVIRIIKSLPYLPVAFDFALYVEGGVAK
ncbi:hypothetical protein ACFLZK_02065 [Patescibacteria group bacterium]